VTDKTVRGVIIRSDSEIKRNVEDELRWDPDIDATDTAVTVNSGVVTLAGFVRSHLQKLNTVTDAKRDRSRTRRCQ
jgi:osmotically-inducible protein OsmY